jgi:hypothetical protein
MEQTANRRPLLAIRFSVALLLFLTACFAGYLGGYKYGMSAAAMDIDAVTFSSRTYDIGDLIRPLDAPPGWIASEGDFDELVQLIKSTIASEHWESGDAKIHRFPANTSLVVFSPGSVHRELDQLLIQLRRQVPEPIASR